MNLCYRAVRSDGRLETGRLAAAGPAELAVLLERRGLELLSWQRSWPDTFLRPRPVPAQEVVTFCFHMMQLLQAGLPLLESLGDVREMTPSPAFRHTISQLADDVAAGQTLAQALQPHPAAFNPVFISLVRAGELSGRLGETFQALHDSLAWQQQLRADARRALLYPAFVAVAVSACAAFLLLYLVPQLRQILLTMGVPLPFYSRLLFALAGTLAESWPALILIPPTSALALLALRRLPRGEWLLAGATLRLPLFGPIFSQLALARLTHTLGTLYASGIPLLDALEHSAAVSGNACIRKAAENARQAVIAGQTLATAFGQDKLFPPLLIRMLQLGERTGRLDVTLLEIARQQRHHAEAAIAQTQRLIEPTLTLIFGLLLGWIALAVFGPLQDLVARVGT